MRKAILLLTAIATMMVVAAGIAIAVDKTGNNKNNTLIGTANLDRLAGGAGADTIKGEGGDDHLDGDAGGDTVQGGAGEDLVTGSAGRDKLNGGPDDDFINAADNRGGDEITCGGGTDTVVRDDDDTVDADCATAVETVVVAGPSTAAV